MMFVFDFLLHDQMYDPSHCCGSRKINAKKILDRIPSPSSSTSFHCCGHEFEVPKKKLLLVNNVV